jgi:hypothetical protein
VYKYKTLIPQSELTVPTLPSSEFESLYAVVRSLHTQVSSQFPCVLVTYTLFGYRERMA